MRVLHLNTNYTYSALHQLMIEALEQTGNIDSHVFMSTFNKNLGVITPRKNVCVCECVRRRDRLFFFHKQRKIRKALEKNIKVAGFDLIHAYTLFTDGNCARSISRKYGIPYVVAVRNTDVNAFFRLQPHLHGRGVQIMRDAAAVFFLSEAYCRQVFEKYVPEKYREEIRKKTYIIPNGIDEFWFENAPTAGRALDQKAVRLIYAGRIDRNKNIPTTQKAMELLRGQGYETTLTVIGKVQDQREYEMIQNGPFTTCLPAVPKEKLIEAYRAADIFVMPSHEESFGLVYAEALSQGLPVVYSKGQGFDGQFPEGTVGYSVDSRSPESVAEGIRRVIVNYPQLAANCIPSIEKFRWHSLCQAYSEVYKQIVCGGNVYE